MKKTIYLIFLGFANSVYADGELIEHDVTTISATFISPNAYSQDPYIGLPSISGTQTIIESQTLSKNVAQKLFEDGTWNVIAQASYMGITGANNYAYGANFFGQTGQVAGFSFGGFVTINNPLFADQMNPANTDFQALQLPINQQSFTPQEAFVEYQYRNIVQADIGYIGINNSPWLTYYQNNAMNLVTYQGASFNINPGAGFLITGVLFNQAQLLGENGFSQLTLYNSNFDPATQTPELSNETSEGTFALGTSWSLPGDWLLARLWDYQFSGYSNMVYGDSTIKLKVDNILGFSIGTQGAVQSGSSNNILNNNGYGTNVQSNMVGLQLGMNYSWVGLQLGYNNIWGPPNAYQGGNLIVPYSYQLNTDPLYTTSWIVGMVEKAAGQAYKISPSATFLDGNLTILPSYAYYATNSEYMPPTTEWDIVANYIIPQIKGFTVYGGYGYILQPDSVGGNVYQAQVMLSYLY